MGLEEAPLSLSYPQESVLAAWTQYPSKLPGPQVLCNI